MLMFIPSVEASTLGLERDKRALSASLVQISTPTVRTLLFVVPHSINLNITPTSINLNITPTLKYLTVHLSFQVSAMLSSLLLGALPMLMALAAGGNFLLF